MTPRVAGQRRTAFVLAGGGSLGAVQVGMLQALAEAGVKPDLLVGTSAGAVNAVWVAGHGASPASLARLAELWRQVRRGDLFPVTAGGILRALAGRSRALTSSGGLEGLVRAHSGMRTLDDAAIPVQLMATNVLTGMPVALEHGGVSDAVRASAAIPGIYPPVLVGGRWLVDGGVAHATGVAQAIRSGATEVYVLPSGYPCALRRPPGTPLGMALHALSLLIEQRLITEVSAHEGTAVIRVLPPLCPLAVSAADFTQAAELTERGLAATRRWLDGGGADRPEQSRILSLHDHHAATASARRPGAAVKAG